MQPRSQRPAPAPAMPGRDAEPARPASPPPAADQPPPRPAPAAPAAPSPVSAGGAPQVVVLDATAGNASPGDRGAAGRLATAGPRGARPEPSWPTVIATTVRLWGGRRYRRARRRLQALRWPGRVALLAIVAAIVAGAVVAAFALSTGGWQDTAARTARHRGPGANAAALAAAAARTQAAEWVARQVSTGATVACDPAMCGALRTQAIAAGRLLVLRAGAPGPLGSGVVVATAAVRAQFGARLAPVYAPVVLARFGTGAARIDVRVVAAGGSGAYLPALAADARARAAAGARLARNRNVRARAPVRRLLAAGEVDSRLLTVLASLAGRHPVAIVAFTSPPGQVVGVRVPLRAAVIAPAGTRRGTSIAALRRFLLAQRPPYRPLAVWTVRGPAHRRALGVKYPAPSPLGLLGTGG
jgi:hypothetical protein